VRLRARAHDPSIRMGGDVEYLIMKADAADREDVRSEGYLQPALLPRSPLVEERRVTRIPG
jgi:hypothetical protein